MATIREALEQALEHHKAGALAEAERRYRAVLLEDPAQADALHLLGVAALQSGRHEEALASLRQAIAAQPATPVFHVTLGRACLAAGRPDEALAAFRQAVQLQPDFIEAHVQLGNTLLTQGRTAEAIPCYEQVLRLRPDHAEVRNNLGTAFLRQGRTDEAIACYRRAAELRPDFALAHHNLGFALRQQGKLPEAVACWKQALRLEPASPGAWYSLGQALKDLGRPDEAEDCFRHALRHDPAHAFALHDLSNLLVSQGLIDEALDGYRRAVALQPGDPAIHGNYLLALPFRHGNDPQRLLEEHRAWAQRHADPLAPTELRFPNDPDPERRLRIGFLLGYWTGLPPHFIGPVLRALDRSRFHVTCYLTLKRPGAPDPPLKSLADRWHDVAGWSDERLAQLIREEQIDILVELAGFEAGNRLLVMARKPAPVQVTQYCYPCTTGLNAIDYRITDPYLDPPGTTEAYHTEELVRLPETAWCYQPPDGPAVGPLPAQHTGRLTFVSFNRLGKLNPEVIALWSRLLQALPGSRLLLAASGTRGDQRIQEAFGRHGVGARVELRARRPADRYLELYHEADIGLDPFPFTGGVTTCDALWMGVPVLSLAGRTCFSRQGVSLLSSVGLNDWIAHSPDEVVEIARRWAEDLPGLARLREGLRGRMAESALVDGRRYTRHLEDTYRTLWRRWCASHRRGEEEGLSLYAAGKYEEAIAWFEQAQRRRPDHAETFLHLGNALFRAGRLDEAAAAYRRALALESGLARAHHNLGVILHTQRKLEEARAAFQEALRCDPDHAAAPYLLAITCKDLGRWDEAEDRCREVLRRQPRHVEALDLLASILAHGQGRVEEALAFHRQAVDLQPDRAGMHGSYLLHLHYVHGNDPQRLLEEHVRWDHRHAAPLAPASPGFPNDPDPERRLRVGFLVGHLGGGFPAHFLEPVLVSRDRSRFYVVCYLASKLPGPVESRLRSLADRCHHVADWSDERVAQQVREEGIDLLVDLAGHAGGGRLLVFAHRSAPVQVTQFGYPGTTGLHAIGYRITDPFLDPPGTTEAFHTEELVRLPEIAWCYQPPDAGPAPNRLPALRRGALTFASFNRLAKLTPEVIALWSQVLQTLPGSRLLLIASSSRGDARIRQAFEEQGVGTQVELRPWRPPAEYLELYHEADVGLDPFPFTGGITTCDALWMGVPVLSLAGRTCVSRQGVSLLSNAGLPDWIARTPEEFVALARRWAEDLPGLSRLRAGLRHALRRSPLLDGRRYTRHLEQAYRELWRRWCRSQGNSSGPGR